MKVRKPIAIAEWKILVFGGILMPVACQSRLNNRSTKITEVIPISEDVTEALSTADAKTGSTLPNSANGFHDTITGPPPSPSNLILAGLSASAFQANWSSNGGSTNGFVISIGRDTTPSTCSAGSDTGLQTFARFSNLIPGETYGVRVCSYDSFGIESIGVTATIDLSDYLSPVVSRLVAVGKSSTSLQVTWTSGGGSTYGYNIAIREGLTPPLHCNGIDIERGTNHTFEGLRSNTYYSVKVCSYDTDYNLSAGRTTNGRTLLPAPPNPAQVVMQALSYEAIRLRWISGGGNTAGYRIAMALGSLPPSCENGSDYLLNQEAIIAGLNQSTEYGIRICSYNSDQVLSQGVAQLVTTMPFIPSLQALPACAMGRSFVATGTGPGAGPHVTVRSGSGLPLLVSAFPFYPKFTGGVRVAMGDIDNDGFIDTVTGAGPGGGPHVEVFSGRTGELIRSFLAYAPSVATGLFVAVGDTNADGVVDIITSVDVGAGPHIKVFSGRDQSELRSFFAYVPTFSGGVRVAAADIDRDGYADIITGAGPGGGPHVQVFSGRSGDSIRSFFAYAPNVTTGIYVAAGDVDGDGTADIITGAGPGGGPHVQAFSGTDGRSLKSFFAYVPSFSGGITVAAADVNGDGLADIITGAGPGGGPHIQVFDSASNSSIESIFAYDPAFLGGVMVAGVTCPRR